MKQGYSARMDESLGMRNGKESMKMQSFKSRRDESYGMGGGLGHEKKPRKCDPYKAQKHDMGRIRMEPRKSKGYPAEAWNYKY